MVLRKGEVQRANGTYHYCWTDGKGKRHFVYAKTLEELRDKEAEIEKDKSDGIKAEAKYTTINDLFDLWKQLKRGLKTTPLRTTNICMILSSGRNLERHESAL